MKKTFIALSALVVSLTSFGQGYFLDTSSLHTVWNTNGAFAAGLDTAFLIGPSGDTPLVESIYTGVATNGVTISASTATTAWSDILSDPNFSLAIATSSSTTPVGIVAANGSSSYSGSTFSVNSTAPSTTYAVFMISWSTQGGTITTPSAAALANDSLGWSKVGSLTAVSSSGTPSSVGSAVGAFGLAVVATPEPSTIALAGLGVSALVAFRRRNSSK